MFWKTRTFLTIYLLVAALILSACAAAPAPSTVETSTPEASEATELPTTQAPQPEETEPPQPEATEPPTSTPTEAAFPPAMRIAYVGADGNVWVLDTGEAEPRQITIGRRHSANGWDCARFPDDQLLLPGDFLGRRAGRLPARSRAPRSNSGSTLPSVYG